MWGEESSDGNEDVEPSKQVKKRQQNLFAKAKEMDPSISEGFPWPKYPIRGVLGAYVTSFRTALASDLNKQLKHSFIRQRRIRNRL